MSSLIQAWTIHDADVALYPAWKDGMPFRGPGSEGDGRRRPEPLLYCKADLNITETWEKGAKRGMDWRGNSEGRSKSYEIAVRFPDGAVADAYGRVVSRLDAGGMYILVVRYASGETWAVQRFFYVTPESDGVGEAGQVLMRPMTFRAGWMQEDIGTGVIPDMEPKVYGEVYWICGALSVPAMRYDPLTEEWSSREENNTGDDSRYVNISPVSDVEGSDVFISYYLPRVTEFTPEDGLSRRMNVVWENRIALSVGRWDSENWHGLHLSEDHTLQQGRFVEPLEMLPQSRMLDEPIVVFRYLARVYAVLGHGVLAVPGLFNTVRPSTHDPAFRISPTGGVNPETGESGLTLLSDGAWLDGEVSS